MDSVLAPGNRRTACALQSRTAKLSRSPASSSESQSEAKRKPRFGMPKVRTGCIVCKIRRVKCDETKPSCVRCTSTGRRCDGYQPVLPRKPRIRRNAAAPKAAGDASAAGCTAFHLFPLSPAPSPTTAIDGVERQSLHFFWTATHHDVSRHFGAQFWGRLVLQAAHAYSAVRHALDAVSTVYEAYARREHAIHRSQGILDTSTTRVALVSYNKAVKLVSQGLSDDAVPLEAVLLCCLLFVWLEFLRNDFATGLRHLSSGLAILQDTPGLATKVDSSIPHIFTRLQIQATLHGCPSSDFNSCPAKWPSDVDERHPYAFSTVAEARHTLDKILVSVFRLVREKQTFEASRGGYQAAERCPEWPQLIARRDTYVAGLLQWHIALRNSLTLKMVGAGEMNSAGVLLLQLNFETALMVLTGLFFRSEMQYDAHDAAFRQMLGLVEKILVLSESQSQTGPALSLSLDTGVIPALCYIILKCREPAIRYGAMATLKRAPEREGMWHRDTIVTATSWKVALEERLAAAVDVFGSAETCPIPLSARIYRERVRDATAEGMSAAVHFDGGPAGSLVSECELKGLISQLGDMI